MTTAIMVTAGTTPMVGLIDALNSMKLLLQWRPSLYVLKYWLGMLQRQLLGFYPIKIRPLVRLTP